jgi:predicted nucleotidyltransferase
MLSGKFVLRIGSQMHRALKEEAHKAGESLNSLCLRKLQGAAGPLAWSALLSVVIQKFEPVGIILFGSQARGEATSSSDVDLLIVLKDDQKLSRQLYDEWDLHLRNFDSSSPHFSYLPALGHPIGSLWLEAALEGEILFDSRDVLKKTLRGIRQRIAEGSYQRKLSSGHAYWIRKGVNEE